MLPYLNTQPMGTSHVVYATGAWQPSDSSVTASQASLTSTMSWQANEHQPILSGSGSQTADLRERSLRPPLRN
jgi:hypothetical protein